MRKGVLQQWGEPYALYDRPANLFVAEFIGSPPMNLFQARVDVEDGTALLVLAEQQIRLPSAFLSRRPALASRMGTMVAVGIRPEYLQDASVADNRHPTLRAHVRLVETLGPERHVHVDLAAVPVLTPEVLEVARDVDVTVAESVAEGTNGGGVRAIARFEPDATVAPGEVRELAVVPEKLRFFDLDSGVTL
jgi:multiple sugar transport system ATP-binding protein